MVCLTDIQNLADRIARQFDPSCTVRFASCLHLTPRTAFNSEINGGRSFSTIVHRMSKSTWS